MNAHKIIVLLATLLIALTGFGQQKPKQKTKEEIEALRVAYITKKLSLTTAEAQAFWPLYNEYTQKREDLRKEHKLKMKKYKESVDEMTDADAQAYIEAEMAYRQKDLDLQKDFYKKLKAVLPAKKIVLLAKAEEDFKKLILEGLSGDKPGGK
ncbi:MAG: sensor of ECF-type sigma factor [Bacteroidota bacterium]